MEKSVSRRSFIGLSGAAATLAGLGLVGCGGSGATDGSTSGTAGGGDLTVGSAYSTQNYNPSTTSSALALSTNLNVMEGLYEIDFHDYTTHAALAAGDPTQTGETTFEVKLRDGATFSDGTAVTAADVAESFNRANATGNIYVSMLAPLASITAQDDTTVLVTTNVPNFSLIKERLAIVKVVPASSSTDDMTKKPIGTGPWMYDSIDDSTIRLVPNPNYNGDHPAKDSALTYSVLKDATARVTAAQQGSSLVCESVPADSIDQLKGAGMSIDTIQGFGTRFLMFDVAKAPWSDARVRQAVMYALNYDKLINNALAGQAEKPSCYLPNDPAFANYHEASVVFDYDVDKAKGLIQEAGVTPGAITLLTTDNDQVVAMAAEVKNDLDALGFTTTISTDTSAATYAAIDKGDNSYDLLLAPGDPSCFGADTDLLLNWWFGDNTWMRTRCPWATSSEWQELNATMQAALNASGDEQQQEWNKCFDLLSENVPLYPVLHVKTTTASWRDSASTNGTRVSSNFKGIGTTGVSLVDVTTVK